jgi:hypothetical protein
MNRNDGLGNYVGRVDLHESSTSYFSTPSETLDPTLFDDHRIKGWVRNGLLNLLYDFLGDTYRQSDLWSTVWLAGSGVSYQWQAQREPADLDVLIGVDYIQFRKAHSEYQGLTDLEISKMLNEDFREHLQPDTTNWNGFEVTFYVNPGATDIRTINPYAAYNLTNNEWTVVPEKQGAPHNAVWEELAKNDRQMAGNIVTRYSQSITDLQNAKNDAARRNAEARLESSLIQGTMLFNNIHQGRKLAFNPTGQGYSDYYNYRWQAGKRSGAIQTLRNIKKYVEKNQSADIAKNYGVDLPDTSTLIRRAATYRATQ